VSYLAFSLLFVAVAAVPAVVALSIHATGQGWGRAVLLAMAALVVLTIVFDSLMVSVGLFHYDPTRALGVDVWLAPVEDLTWPVASAVLLPSMWALSGRVRSREGRSAPRPAPRPRPRRQAGPPQR
jgi:small toxic polypeptide LdrA/B/C/D